MKGEPPEIPAFVPLPGTTYATVELEAMTEYLAGLESRQADWYA